MSSMREPLPTPPDNEDGGAVETTEPEIFNPAIHASDKKSGKPIRNKDGTLRLKPGVKKKSKPNDAAPGALAKPEDSPAAEISTAVILTGTIENVCKILISPAWEMTAEEKKAAIESWTTLLDRYNIIDLPPSLSVLAIYGTYAAGRLEKDKQTRGKFSNLWDRICGKIGRTMLMRRFAKQQQKQEKENGAEKT